MALDHIVTCKVTIFSRLSREDSGLAAGACGDVAWPRAGFRHLPEHYVKHSLSQRISIRISVMPKEKGLGADGTASNLSWRLKQTRATEG